MLDFGLGIVGKRAKRKAERFNAEGAEIGALRAQRKSAASSGDCWLISCGVQVARNSSGWCARLGPTWRVLFRRGGIRRGVRLELRRRIARNTGRCLKCIAAGVR